MYKILMMILSALLEMDYLFYLTEFIIAYILET